jgi:glycine/sarcosine N-methyltransferase
MATPAEFYDALASDYHLLFGDWWSAAEWNGGVIADVLASREITQGRLLDCTCGVGTQALPLAALGFRVTGTDVSAAAVDRARAEATTRALDVEFAVTDVRDVRDHVDGIFDVVISCDNALPHLLTDDALVRALRSIRSCLQPAGVLLVSLRDYDSLRVSRPDGVPISVHGRPGARHGSGQSWRWSVDAEYVDIELFTFIEDAAGSWQTRSRATRYRAIQRATLETLLASVGFRAAEWIKPDVSGYYQPLVLATA